MIYAMAELEPDGQESGYIKIGFVAADDVAGAVARIRRRLIDLQQGNPRRLVVVGIAKGTRAHEKALHQQFDSDRVRRPTRSEWVKVSGAVQTWLDAVRLEEPIAICHALGRGSRGGPVKENLGLNRCSLCKETGHNAARCLLGPVNGNVRVRRRKTWTWRDKVRAA
jgi:hypothetical protein